MFQDISFDGQQMVVELAEDHGVQKLNLIGPDGTGYQSVQVTKGASKVKMPVLHLGSGEAFHYPVGQSKLVPVGPQSPSELKMTLEPSLEIKSGNHYTEGEGKAEGNLGFVVENSGNAPTWVYRIFYDGVPNEEAADKTGNKEEPSLVLKKPSSDQGAIIGPGDQQTVVGNSPPIVFSEEPNCDDGSVTGSVVIDSPVQALAEAKFKVSLSGERQDLGQSGFSSQYTCDDLTVEISSEEVSK